MFLFVVAISSFTALLFWNFKYNKKIYEVQYCYQYYLSDPYIYIYALISILTHPIIFSFRDGIRLSRYKPEMESDFQDINLITDQHSSQDINQHFNIQLRKLRNSTRYKTGNISKIEINWTRNTKGDCSGCCTIDTQMYQDIDGLPCFRFGSPALDHGRFVPLLTWWQRCTNPTLGLSSARS